MSSTTDSSQAHYEVDVRYDVRIPTADPDVTLAADLYLPVTTDPVPLLVSAYPYRKDMNGVGLSPLHLWFGERGYASLVIDLRGTGCSDGQYVEFDPVEGQDSVGAINWAAAQPWCDGNVGMWGHSYGAITTMRAASLAPSALKAIIPVQGSIDVERFTVHADYSRSDLHTFAFRGAQMLLTQLVPPLSNYTSAEEQHRWLQRIENNEPIALDYARHRPGDPVWRSRAIDATAIVTPALCIGGWKDPHCEGITRAFAQMSGPKKLLMGPWTHTLPHAARVEALDFLEMSLRWWNHWLRASDTGVMDEPAVTLYLGDSHGWRGLDTWPPATSEFVLAAGSDTTLVQPAADRSAPTHMIGEYQPDPTAGILSGMWGTIFHGSLDLDQHDDDLRGLPFTSDPLTEDLLIVGWPEVTVRLVPDHPAVNSVQRLVIRLAEVDPQGRSTFITGGVLCPKERSDTYTIPLRAVACTVRAGQRVRVVLSDADFPRLTPLPNPTPVPLAGLEISLPILDEDPGVALDMPTLPSTPVPVMAAPGAPGNRVSITREPVRDSIDIAFCGRSPSMPTRHGHTMQTESALRAIVQRSAPDGAVISGTHKIVLHMTTGEEVKASAIVRVTQTSMWAQGEVTIDDLRIFSRIWQAPLS